MKCHKILGIEENATEQEIAVAYHNKYYKLCNNTELLQDDNISIRSNELFAAKMDCIKWLTMSSSEKRSMRIRESKETLNNPNIMYSSPIGCCSMCCSEWRGCCGGEVVDCGNTVDCGCYIALGIPAIFGIFAAIAGYTKNKRKQKIMDKIQTLDYENTSIERKREKLKNDNNSIQRNIEYIEEKFDEYQQLLSAEKNEYKSMDSFCRLFEMLGCDNLDSIRQRQQSGVTRQKNRIEQLDQDISRLNEKVKSNESEIKEINRNIQSNKSQIADLEKELSQLK